MSARIFARVTQLAMVTSDLYEGHDCHRNYPQGFNSPARAETTRLDESEVDIASKQYCHFVAYVHLIPPLEGSYGLTGLVVGRSHLLSEKKMALLEF